MIAFLKRHKKWFIVFGIGLAVSFAMLTLAIFLPPSVPVLFVLPLGWKALTLFTGILVAGLIAAGASLLFSTLAAFCVKWAGSLFGSQKEVS